MDCTDGFTGSILRPFTKRRERSLCLTTHLSFPLKRIDVVEDSQKRHLARSHSRTMMRQEDDRTRDMREVDNLTYRSRGFRELVFGR